jgi:Domain of unknown function (DUF4178)
VLFLLALSCLAVATVGSVYVYQRNVAGRLPAGARAALPARGDERAAAESARTEATLETLALGDIVQDGDLDFVVEGALRYREERDAWGLFSLDAGNEQRWLEVRRYGGQTTAAFLELTTDAPLFGQLGAGLTYRGKSFTVSARGDARTTLEGDVGARTGGILKYARYTGPGGELLVVEEEAGVRRAWFGRSVPPSSLAILGGELVRARDAEQT